MVINAGARDKIKDAGCFIQSYGRLLCCGYLT